MVAKDACDQCLNGTSNDVAYFFFSCRVFLNSQREREQHEHLHPVAVQPQPATSGLHGDVDHVTR